MEMVSFCGFYLNTFARHPNTTLQYCDSNPVLLYPNLHWQKTNHNPEQKKFHLVLRFCKFLYKNIKIKPMNGLCCGN